MEKVDNDDKDEEHNNLSCHKYGLWKKLLNDNTRIHTCTSSVHKTEKEDGEVEDDEEDDRKVEEELYNSVPTFWIFQLSMFFVC